MTDTDDIAKLGKEINNALLREASSLGDVMNKHDATMLKILKNSLKVGKTEKSNNKKTSKYSQVEKRHEYIWRIIKHVVERAGSYKEMREAIKTKKQIVKGKGEHVPVPNNATLKTIIEKYSRKQNETE